MKIICADDFGLSPAITDAIIELGSHGVIQATSVMTEAALARQSAMRLKDSGLSAGLHFNLTHEFDDTPFGLHRLMLLPSLPRSGQESVRLRLRRQLDAFEDIFKAPPDFLDGHQHVHCFPSIRSIFLQELSQRYPGTEKPWIRQVEGAGFNPGAVMKARIISLMNTGFAANCAKDGFKTNDNFAGIYDFSPHADYNKFLDNWLAAPDVLIMCHPSNAVEAGDEISPARFNEYKALKSRRIV